MFNRFAATATVKFPGAFTVSAMGVVALRLPSVPVTVTAAVPVAAVALAVKVIVLVPVAGLGLNAAVTPLGRPEAARVTLPVNPFNAFMVMVLAPLPPCATLNAVGADDSV